MNAQNNAQNVQASNLAARNLVIQNAIDMWQPIYSTTLSGSALGQVVNIPLRNVGLVKRLVVVITANAAQSAAETHTRTPLGPANLLSNVVLTDLSNQTRINTSGWHLHMLATARRQAAFGAAFTNDSPVNVGSNFSVISAPATFTTSQPIKQMYEIPLAYSDFDLRGAIFANVVNATFNLQLTVNNNFSVASGADRTLACYQSSTAALASLTGMTITVYQNYLDQLPVGQNGPVLPMLDLSTAYLINNTVVTGLSVNSDNPVPYANFRNFMSTMMIYDNNGALNVGSDIAYFSLQSANYTNIFKQDPFVTSLKTREMIGDDFPAGMYYFDHRTRPISTVQYGNMQLIVNPSNVGGAGSQLYVGFEALALINQITQAGSLYSN